MATGPDSAQVTSTPGRRRKPTKGDRTSQAILDTAAGLLETRALSEITVDEIAAGAGISRSAFYFHFATREAVLYTLAERVTEELYSSATIWLRRSAGRGVPGVPTTRRPRPAPRRRAAPA